MAGIKQIVAPPETFRFPRWKSNINYAPDSVIAHNSYGLDSDSTSLYIARIFIPAGENRPNLNANWVEMAADAAAINAIVRAQLDQDSDMIVMRAVNRRLDSETNRQRQVDSDFQKEADSEAHWWRAKDSDIKRNFADALDSEMHDRKAADSDLNVRVDDADSDIARLRGWVNTLLNENDSDNLVQNVDHDSDIAMVYHDFRGDDSDILVIVQRLKDQVDSDNIVSKPEHDSDVKMLYHDYRAEDSDQTVELIRNIDSETLARKGADSDLFAYFTAPAALDYGNYF